MSIRYRCSCNKSFPLEEEFLGKLVRCPFCGRQGIVDLSETLSQIEKEASDSFVPPIPPLKGAAPPRGSADRWAEQPGFHSQLLYALVLGGIAVCIVIGSTFAKFLIYAPSALPPQLNPHAQQASGSRPVTRFPLPNNAKPQSLAANWVDAAGQRISKREMQRKLSQSALQAAQQKNYTDAIAHEYVAIELEGGSHYDLARYYAMNQQYSHSLHWLEQSFEHEFTDRYILSEEEAFLPLQEQHPAEWDTITEQYEAWYAYFRDYHQPRNILITPAKYSSNNPIPLMVVLAESGSAPQEILDDYYTQLSKQYQVAVLLIGGPDTPALKDSFWDFRDDLRNKRQVQGAILGAGKQSKLDMRQILLVGVGDAGTLALEMSLKNPAIYGGCLVIAPSNPIDINTFFPKAPQKEHLTQVYALLIESPDAEDRNPIDEKVAERIRQDYLAEVKLTVLDEVKEGTVPTDFSQALSEWLDSVLKARSAKHLQ